MMRIELETEFAIIKSEDGTGYFISANTEDLNTLIKKIPEFQKYKTTEEFWEIYSDEDARLLLSYMIASDVPFIKNGWDSISPDWTNLYPDWNSHKPQRNVSTK